MDQAATLRRWMNEQVEQGIHPPPSSRGVRVLAITSGKGGVGKTNVVANLALALVRLGKRVLILDADLGLGSLDVLLGLTPQYTLEHLFSGEKSLQDILIQGPEGMWILPAASGVQELTHLTDAQKLTLLSQLESLNEQVDLMLIDTAAGISQNVTYFASAAQEIIVVVSPEPTSITDAYALIKVLHKHHGEDRFKLLANLVRSPREGKEIYRKIAQAVDHFLHVSLDYLGHVFSDDHVSLAVREQRLVLDLYPRAKASRCFTQLAEEILRWPDPGFLKGSLQFFWNRMVGLEDQIPSHPGAGV